MAHGRVNVGGGGLQIKNKITGVEEISFTIKTASINLPSNLNLSNCFVYVYVNGGSQYPGSFNVRAYLKEENGQKTLELLRGYGGSQLSVTYNVIELSGAKQIITQTFTVEDDYNNYSFVNIPNVLNYSKALLFFSSEFDTNTANENPTVEFESSNKLKISTKSSKLRKTTITIFIVEPY